MSISSSTTRHLRGVVVCGLVAAPFVAAPLLPPAAAAVPTCNGLRATIVGTEGRDVIEGTTGRDVIVGLGGNDVIDGGYGSDVICGGGGSDRLIGGPGNDRLFGQADRIVYDRSTYYVGDVLVPGPGNDLLVPGPATPSGSVVGDADTIRFDGAERGVTVDLGEGTASGQGADTIRALEVRVVGTPYDDELVAGDRAAELRGAAGDDLLVGGPGGDVLRPDAPRAEGDVPGDDLVRSGNGPDFVFLGGGADDVSTGAGDDYVSGTTAAPGPVRLGGGSDYVGLDGVASAGSLDVRSSGDERDSVDLGLLTPGEGPWTWDLAAGTVGGPDGTTGSVPALPVFAGVTSALTPVEVTGSGRVDKVLVSFRVSQPVTFDGGPSSDEFSGGKGEDTFRGGLGEDTYFFDESRPPRSNTCVSVENDQAGACRR